MRCPAELDSIGSTTSSAIASKALVPATTEVSLSIDNSPPVEPEPNRPTRSATGIAAAVPRVAIWLARVASVAAAAQTETAVSLREAAKAKYASIDR